MGNCCSSQPAANTDNENNDDDFEINSKREPIDIDNYKIGRTLGTGASCKVVAAVNRRSKLQVAIKMIPKENSSMEKLFKREINVLSRLCPAQAKDGYHKNILQFEGYGEDESTFYIVTKLLEGGELFDRIVSQDEKYIITEKQASLLIRDMLTALKYCHDKHIVHRDLKPENFVFASTDVKSDIVLIDYGCACVVKDDETIDNIVGTAYYLAPELACVALDKSYKAGSQSPVMKKIPQPQPRTGRILRAADLWSMGVIAYVMMTGRAPFRGKDNQGIFESICLSKLTFPDKDARYYTDLKLSEPFKDFVERILVKNPADRISLEEALRHPWVQGIETADFRLNKDVIHYLRQFNYQSKLKKEITRILAANMSQQPETEVRKHFQRLDADKDGYLDIEELKYLLLDMGYVRHEADAEAVKMVHHADRNLDGKVDFEEFKAVWYRKVLTTNDQYIHRVFGVFDKNGDGHVDAKELQTILFPENKLPPPEKKEDDNDEDENLNVNGFAVLTHIQRMIDEIDENRDHVISFEEFKKAMKEDLESGDVKWQSVIAGGELEGHRI